MEILLDEMSTEIEETGIRNLEEILLKIATDYVRQGQVITAVKLNGEFYSEENQHDAAGILLTDIESLELHTMAADEIAWQFLENGVSQLYPIIESAQKISELFRIADEGEANEQYGRFLDALRFFLRMVDEVRGILQLDFSTILVEGSTVEDKVQVLSEMIGRMLEIQEEEDWIILADLLEYEMVPLLEEWRSILPLLKERKKT
ncbi:MAG: hypothetical protein SV775_16800 [Thermodesulfobacteriota bacterium]|nr:hypothetical protein [Thermodesulfobacteriota bacterium]